jgi:hypothetical protein
MLTVTLHHTGRSPQDVLVSTLEEASSAVTSFQLASCMASSDAGERHGEVRRGQALLYTVSYNGRVWSIKPAGDAPYVACVYDPAEVHYG